MKTTLNLVLACLILYGCKKDDCISIGRVQIEETIIPDTIAIDEPVQISVRASATSLCPLFPLTLSTFNAMSAEIAVPLITAWDRIISWIRLRMLEGCIALLR